MGQGLIASLALSQMVHCLNASRSQVDFKDFGTAMQLLLCHMQHETMSIFGFKEFQPEYWKASELNMLEAVGLYLLPSCRLFGTTERPTAGLTQGCQTPLRSRTALPPVSSPARRQSMNPGTLLVTPSWASQPHCQPHLEAAATCLSAQTDINEPKGLANQAINLTMRAMLLHSTS